MATLEVRNLQTSFFTKAGEVKAVDDVSFTVDRGQVLGLVGESGSGKTVTGFSIMGLVDAPGRVVGGQIQFQGEDLVGVSPKRWQALRGNQIAMVFQDPMMTLNPVLRIDTQMIEAIRAHQRVSRDQARVMARDALGQVGIPSADERLKAYPHQFSGGMRQRVSIAIALLNRPDLIVADEPTTALDVTIQGQILYEVQKLCRDTGTALIWITHDLSVIAGLADVVAVMYAGRIVEFGEVRRGRLGVVIQDLTRDLAEAFGIDTEHGAVIAQVMPDSAAADAGLKEADVITAVNERPVKGATDLRNIIGLSRSNEEVEIEYFRNGQQTTVRVKLRPAEVAIGLGEKISQHLTGATLADSEDGELAGVRVTEVEFRSPAWKAGLRKNDLIVSINRERVKNIDDVKQVVSKHSAGVLLQIKRGDSALFLAIR